MADKFHPPLRPTKKNLLHSPIPPSPPPPHSPTQAATQAIGSGRRPRARRWPRRGGRRCAAAGAKLSNHMVQARHRGGACTARAAVVTHTRTQSRQPSPSPAAQCAVGAGCAARTASAAAPIGGVVRCGQAQQPRGARRVSAHLFGLHWPAISKFSDPLRHHA